MRVFFAFWVIALVTLINDTLIEDTLIHKHDQWGDNKEHDRHVILRRFARNFGCKLWPGVLINQFCLQMRENNFILTITTAVVKLVARNNRETRQCWVSPPVEVCLIIGVPNWLDIKAYNIAASCRFSSIRHSNVESQSRKFILDLETE